MRVDERAAKVGYSYYWFSRVRVTARGHLSLSLDVEAIEELAYYWSFGWIRSGVRECFAMI